MRTTTADRSNLARFGCALSAKENLISIGWDQERRSDALSANILATLIYNKWPSGPLLCLAFEISPTKARPHYCFFPFDLKNKIHKNYLSHISRRRRIELRFLAGSRQIMRTYEIPPHRFANLVESCGTAISALKGFPLGLYDFDCAVTEFEQNVRLVDHFQYALTDSELRRTISLKKEQAAKVASENRTRATHIVNGLLGDFRPQGDSRKNVLKKIRMLTRCLMICADLHGQFEGDYDGVAQFLTDAIAVHPHQEDIQHLETTSLLFKSIRTMRNLKQGFDQPEEAKAQVGADFRDVIARLAGGQGLSLKALGNLLSTIGVPLGQPGRSPRDYSVEYALKAKGTWSKAAAYTLENHADTRKEFGFRKYPTLSVSEKRLLKNRVREGVRSYAERTGKPFPPKEETQTTTADLTTQ